mmetsp:Transcript_24291/g.60664  ORF Transcript_24291/g.60664 Transcript_24291/m.60664 type:complete len:223 (+) Transcript_24291:548-1216(+)
MRCQRFATSAGMPTTGPCCCCCCMPLVTAPRAPAATCPKICGNICIICSASAAAFLPVAANGTATLTPGLGPSTTPGAAPAMSGVALQAPNSPKGLTSAAVGTAEAAPADGCRSAVPAALVPVTVAVAASAPTAWMPSAVSTSVSASLWASASSTGSPSLGAEELLRVKSSASAASPLLRGRCCCCGCCCCSCCSGATASAAAASNSAVGMAPVRFEVDVAE